VKRIKGFFKGWNAFEVVFLCLILITPALLTIVFESSIVECLSTTLYLFWCLLGAKGKSYTHIIGIPAIFLYAYVAYNANYYGEVIITFFVLLPLIIVSLYAWLKNKTSDAHVVVAKPNTKEMIIVACSQIAMGVGYYFLLRAFNTDFLLVSTISIMTSVFATYLIMRRNQFSFPAYIINDIVLIILWGYLCFGGAWEYIPILLMPVMLLINDVYGTINWARLRKQQGRSNKK